MRASDWTAIQRTVLLPSDSARDSGATPAGSPSLPSNWAAWTRTL